MLQDTTWDDFRDSMTHAKFTMKTEHHKSLIALEAEQRRSLDSAIDRMSELHLNAQSMPMAERISVLTQSRLELRDRIDALVETVRRSGTC